MARWAELRRERPAEVIMADLAPSAAPFSLSPPAVEEAGSLSAGVDVDELAASDGAVVVVTFAADAGGEAEEEGEVEPA